MKKDVDKPIGMGKIVAVARAIVSLPFLAAALVIGVTAFVLVELAALFSTVAVRILGHDPRNNGSGGGR